MACLFQKLFHICSLFEAPGGRKEIWVGDGAPDRWSDLPRPHVAPRGRQKWHTAPRPSTWAQGASSSSKALAKGIVSQGQKQCDHLEVGQSSACRPREHPLSHTPPALHPCAL